MDVVRCPGCGEENPSRFRLCGYCGTSLTLPVVASVSCPACGSENPAGFRFCGFCGTVLDPQSAGPAGPPGDPMHGGHPGAPGYGLPPWAWWAVRWAPPWSPPGGYGAPTPPTWPAPPPGWGAPPPSWGSPPPGWGQPAPGQAGYPMPPVAQAGYPPPGWGAPATQPGYPAPGWAHPGAWGAPPAGSTPAGWAPPAAQPPAAQPPTSPPPLAAAPATEQPVAAPPPPPPPVAAPAPPEPSATEGDQGLASPTALPPVQPTSPPSIEGPPAAPFPAPAPVPAPPEPAPASARPAAFPGFEAVAAAPAALPSQEIRKIVTIIFSDLKGSTALTERIDAEAINEVKERYFTARWRPRSRATAERSRSTSATRSWRCSGSREPTRTTRLRAVRAAYGMTVAMDEPQRGPARVLWRRDRRSHRRQHRRGRRQHATRTPSSGSPPATPSTWPPGSSRPPRRTRSSSAR